ncbi:MAG: peptide chain release factor N(5)-glutamine methyltransferase [Bacilli bacterium]
MSLDNRDIEYLKKYLPHDKLEDGLRLLEDGKPVQYIVGNVDFYGNTIKVNESVLIPRFETELLVDKTIKLINKYFNKKVDILDIGTGSGCIAITLDKLLNCNIDGIDISDKALVVAKKNNKINGTNVQFYQSDIFTNVNKKYDVIISNPPYISRDEKIMDIVYNNEPHTALYADDNGLYFYDKILRDCKNYLKNRFIIAFEIGCKQGSSVKRIANKYLTNTYITIEKDYNGMDRFVFIVSKE